MLAAFDFLVAATAYIALRRARQNDARDLFAVVGYLCITIAAIIGTIKFLGFANFAAAHNFTSTIAAAIGVPLVAIGFILSGRSIATKYAVVTVAAVTIAGISFRNSEMYVFLTGVFAQIIWTAGGWLYHKLPGHILARAVTSVVLTSIAGILFDGSGIWLGMQKENIFHGLLALAIMQQALAFESLGDVRIYPLVAEP